MTNPNEPIYPCERTVVSSKECEFPDGTRKPVGVADFVRFNGLTKREYFAALAMQGIVSIAAKTFEDEVLLGDHKSVAEQSVRFADALIKALEATPNRGSSGEEK